MFNKTQKCAKKQEILIQEFDIFYGFLSELAKF